MLNVLLIEDSPMMAEFIKTILKDKVNIIVAATLLEAHPHYLNLDVVLLDLELPDSAGLKTLEHVYKFVECPIIILTGNVDESQALEAIKMGAQDYLIKGELNPIKLWHTILYAIERYNRTNIETRINVLTVQFDMITEKLDKILKILDSKDVKHDESSKL